MPQDTSDEESEAKSHEVKDPVDPDDPYNLAALDDEDDEQGLKF